MNAVKEWVTRSGKASGRWYLMPVSILLLGTVSIALLGWINDIRETQTRNFALNDAIQDIQFTTATSHLWLEEWISGDASVDIDKVMGDIDKAVGWMGILLDGGTYGHGYTFAPLVDPELRPVAESMDALLKEFRTLARERVRRKETSGVGTFLDQGFDRLFLDFDSRATSLNRIVEERRARGNVESRRIFLGIVFIWTSIVVVAATGLWHRERQRMRTEEALHEAHDRLEQQVEERTRDLTAANRRLQSEIVERGLTEIALRESEGNFRKLSRQFYSLLDAIPDCIILVSSDLEIVWANRAAGDATSRGMGDLTGQYCYTVWHNRQSPCDNCPAMRSFFTGEPEACRVSSPDGRLWDLRTFPIRNEETKEYNVIEIAADVTKKVIVQPETVRAAHLALVGELAAGVAQEIDDPIRGIVDGARLLLEERGSEGATGDIPGRIMKEGSRIAGMVKSLALLAREEPDRKRPVRVPEILSESLALTEPQLRKEGIRLLVSLPPDIPEIIANFQQVQQVFLNVIHNARYALQQRYPEPDENKVIEIAGEEVTIDDRRYVRIAFLDRGTGIPSELQDKILIPFFSTKPGGKGTGLGLSVSHGIINDHGGRLGIESIWGKFTRVVVDLPCKTG